MSKTKSVKNTKKSKQTVPTNSRKSGLTYVKLSFDQKLVVIAERKKRGDNIAIANELGYTPAYVSQVTTGVHFNKTIVNRMYTKVRGRKVKTA